jgi:hypothetical protein
MRGLDPKENLLLQIRGAGLPPPQVEYRFHDTRRWRFDLAFPDAKVAVEYDGIFGRHDRQTWGILTAFLERMDGAAKANDATALQAVATAIGQAGIDDDELRLTKKERKALFKEENQNAVLFAAALMLRDRIAEMEGGR